MTNSLQIRYSVGLVNEVDNILLCKPCLQHSECIMTYLSIIFAGVVKQAYKLGFLLLVTLYLSACSQPEPQEKEIIRPVSLYKVKEDRHETREFSGRAKAVQEIDLAFRVPGSLLDFPVSVGDSLSAGQVIAAIDPETYENALALANARVAQVESELTYQKREYQRAQDIRSRNKQLISKEELDRRIRNLKSTQAQVLAAKAELDMAEDKLRYTTLRAPFSGEVSKTYVENYEGIAAAQAVVRIVDISRIEMTVDLPEHLISSAYDVGGIEVRFDAFPNTPLPAQIKERSAEADPITGTYPVTLDIPRMSGRAKGSRLLKNNNGEFLVPVNAVARDAQSQEFIWRYDAQTGSVNKVSVKTNSLRHDGVFVTGTLEQGDLIVTAGVYQLEAGQRVKPMSVKSMSDKTLLLNPIAQEANL